jgi:hypothetical protein
MPKLTRRRYPERADCWHIFYGDVHVGTIARCSGVPVDVDQWEFACGFYPGIRPSQDRGGTAGTFDQARANFERAWSNLLPTLTETDFQEWREAEAWTRWKYAMWDSRHQLSTATTSGTSKRFCGSTISIGDMNGHVQSSHMDAARIYF